MSFFSLASILGMTLTANFVSAATARLSPRLANLWRAPLARDSATYIAASAFQTATKVVVVPIMVTVLTPADYGRLALFQVLFGTATMITFLAMRPPIVRQLTASADGENACYVSSAILLIAGLAALLIVAALAFHRQATRLFALPVTIIAPVVLLGAAQSTYQVYLAILQAQMRVWRYAALQCGLALLNLLLTVFLLVVWRAGWASQALGYAVCAVCGCMIAVAGIGRQQLWHTPSIKHVRELFTLGIGIVPTSLLANSVDRMILATKFAASDVGFYALAQQVSMVALLFGSGITVAVTPWAFRKMSRCQTGADWMRMIAALGAIAALIIAAAFVYGLLVLGVGSAFPTWRYIHMLRYFPWLLAATGFFSLYQLFMLPLYFFKSVKLLAASGALVAGANISLALSLPSFFGSVGVAMALGEARLLQCAFVFGAGLWLIRRRVILGRRQE